MLGNVPLLFPRSLIFCLRKRRTKEYHKLNYIFVCKYTGSTDKCENILDVLSIPCLIPTHIPNNKNNSIDYYGYNLNILFFPRASIKQYS